MRQLYNFEYRVALSEMGSLNGRRLDKFFEPSQGTFRMDFGQDSLIVALGSHFYLTKTPPQAPTEPSAFAMLLRKHLSGEKLTSFLQHGSDRIFTLLFPSGKSVVLEMFAGGNLFLLDQKGCIIRPYHFKQTEKKKYKVGQKYEYPQSLPFHFPPTSKEWNALAQDAPLSSTLPKWPIGKLYVLEALARAKISPERKPSDLSDAHIDGFLKALSQMLKNPAPCAYLSQATGEVAELSLTSLASFPQDKFILKQFPSCGGAIEFYFSQMRAKQEQIASEALPPELIKLKHRLSEQQSALSSTEEEIASVEAQAKYLSENLALIEGRLEEINSGAGCPVFGKNESVDWKKKKYTIKF